MTVCGTLFAFVVAGAFSVMSDLTVIRDREFEGTFLYFCRLSSAVTEFIILIVVLVGYLPFFPDSPVIKRFDMINMHVIIPILTVVSFVFHDPPIGKISRLMQCNGLIFICLYSVTIMVLILIGVLPDERAPYSFLRIHQISLEYFLFASVSIYAVGYSLSLLFSTLNRKAAWLWFRNISGKRIV